MRLSRHQTDAIVGLLFFASRNRRLQREKRLHQKKAQRFVNLIAAICCISARAITRRYTGKVGVF
jgi:hypothetical protein